MYVMQWVFLGGRKCGRMSMWAVEDDGTLRVCHVMVGEEQKCMWCLLLKLTIPGECIMSVSSSVMCDVIIPTDQPLRPVPIDTLDTPIHSNSLPSPPTALRAPSLTTGFAGRIRPRHTRSYTLSHRPASITRHNPSHPDHPKETPKHPSIAIIPPRKLTPTSGPLNTRLVSPN